MRLSCEYLRKYKSLSKKISLFMSVRDLNLSNKLFNFCYFTIYKKKRKYFLCLGLCLKINKLRCSIYLINSKDGVIIKYLLPLNSPALVRLNLYNTFSYCISPNKLKKKTKFNIIHFDNTPSLYSDYDSVQYNISKFLKLKKVGVFRWHAEYRRHAKKLKKRYRL